MEEATEYQKALVGNIIDFEKAFDSLCFQTVQYGAPDKMIRTMKALDFGFECAVQLDGKFPSYFQASKKNVYFQVFSLCLGLIES